MEKVRGGGGGRGAKMMRLYDERFIGKAFAAGLAPRLS